MPNPLVPVVLAALLSLPSYLEFPEEPEQREERLYILAIAIDRAVAEMTCRDRDDSCTPEWTRDEVELAMLLVTQGWWESRFARHIHAGHCRVRIGECDYGRARTVWQLQLVPPLTRKYWISLDGLELDATTRAATAAALVLSRSVTRCGTLTGGVSLYAGARRCQWSGARRRIETWERLMNELVRSPSPSQEQRTMVAASLSGWGGTNQRKPN